MPGILDTISNQLVTAGYAHTNLDELGLERPLDLVGDIEQAVNASEGSHEAMEVVKHIDKASMTIVQDKECLGMGRDYVRPIIAALFAHDEHAVESWDIFGMNRYEAGGRFGPHRDFVGKTVLVFTVTGERDFDIYETAPEDPEDKTDFDTVEASFRQLPGSVMILDREKDPAHAVRLARTDGIVTVADVDGVIRV